MSTQSTKKQTAKHTPGPWHVIDHAFPGLSHKDRPIVDDVGDTILAVRGYGVVESIRDANARLIAAAPDLLAACEKIVNRWADDDPIQPAWILEARAAIAKAKGQA